MDSRGIPVPARVYEDFEPAMEWVPEDDCDTLLVYLPGFAKEQLRVQLRSRNLIISGERKLKENSWSRFRVELPVSVNCDLMKISAKFEGNILFVRQPKLITPAATQEEEKPPVALQVPTPEKPVDEPKVAQNASDEKPTSTTRPNGESRAVGRMGPRWLNVPKTRLEKKSEKVEGKASESMSPKGVCENASEKGKGVCENASEKKASDPGKKHKKVVHGELDKTTKTALDNYKRAVGVFVTKLKTSRNNVNTTLILLVGLVIGVYVSDSIKTWMKA